MAFSFDHDVTQISSLPFLRPGMSCIEQVVFVDGPTRYHDLAPVLAANETIS
jgi:hypothetical protein